MSCVSHWGNTCQGDRKTLLDGKQWKWGILASFKKEKGGQRDLPSQGGPAVVAIWGIEKDRGGASAYN